MTARFLIATLQAVGSLVELNDAMQQPCEPNASRVVCDFVNSLA